MVRETTIRPKKYLNAQTLELTVRQYKEKEEFPYLSLIHDKYRLDMPAFINEFAPGDMHKFLKSLLKGPCFSGQAHPQN